MSKFFKRWDKNCKIKVIGLSIGGCFEPGMVMLKAISFQYVSKQKEYISTSTSGKSHRKSKNF